MPYVVSQLMAVLGFEDREFTTGMRRSREEVKKTKTEVEEASKRFERMGRTLSSLGGTLSVGVTAPLLLLGRQVVKAAVDLDSLKMGLRAVEGSSTATERALKRLQEVAKIPGLGFKESIQGYINLRASGMAADQAEKSLRGFGNALATVGKGKEDLEGVILALTQIQAKGKVSAEEINQLAERVPQIRQMMKDAFGTADTELIQKAGISSEVFIRSMTDAALRFKQASSSMKNDMDNAAESIERSLARLGTSLAPKVALGLGKLADEVERLSKAWENLPSYQQDILVRLGIAGLIAGPTLVGLGKVIELLLTIRNLTGAGAVASAAGGAAAGGAGLLARGAVAGRLGLYGLAGWAAYEGLNAIGQESILGSEKSIGNTSLGNQERIGFLQKEIARKRKIQGQFKPGSGTYRSHQSDIEAMQREMGTLSRFETGQVAKNALKALDPKAYVEGILNGKTPTYDAATMAAKAKADADAKKSGNRASQRASDEAKRHNENFARNTQEGKDELALLNAKDEFERDRIRARLKLRDNLKSMDPATARSIYNAEIREIDQRERQAHLRSLEGSGMAGDVIGSVASTVKSVQARVERRRKLAEGLAKMPDKATPVPYTLLDPRRMDGTRLSALDSLRSVAQGSVTMHNIGSPVGMTGQDATDYASSVVRWQRAMSNAYPTARALGRGGSGFVLDAISGNRQAVTNLRDNLIDALRQGAGQEIERVIVRSLTNPIARALEAGFDPVTKKLEGAISGALKGVTGTAAMLISSSYALLAASQRKRKFGLGSFIGTVGGFLAGGPAGAVAGYNIGNALDNGDMTGAVIGGATAYGSGAFGPQGGQATTPGGFAQPVMPNSQPIDGRAVQIINNGWTVNDKADEKRLLNNMATRVRNAVTTGAY